MPFHILRDDIANVRADAIVNVADPDPAYNGGKDTADCRYDGEAGVTPAGDLPAKYIIHTVSPVWTDGRHGEWDILASCYRRSLLLAEQLGCGSIAFPLISAGGCGFPKERALAVAVRQIREFLEGSEMEVLLVVFDKTEFCLPGSLMEDVRQYVDDHYVSKSEEECAPHHKSASVGSLPDAVPDAAKERRPFRKRLRRRKQQVYPDLSMPVPQDTGSLPAIPEETLLYDRLQDVMQQVGESFQERLFRLIDERGLSDPQVYKRANIDRKLFSKIRCNTEYSPGKRTVLALAVALELNPDQAADLLARAGFAFSPSSRMDLIVKYCIEHHIYDIIEVNTILFEYDLPLLG